MTKFGFGGARLPRMCFAAVAAAAAWLRALPGASVTSVFYPDAVHSFDRRQDEYRDACDDAWPRIVAFTAAHAVGA